MKRLILLSTLIFAVYSISSAQTTKGTRVKTPDIYFESTSYDFGTIAENEDAVITFKFFNSGTAPLLIKNVKPACGCTASEYTKEPVMPGKSGIITATFHSAGYKAQNVHKSITVTTNVLENGNDKVIVVYFKGYVK
jgi:hypothetical protein